MATNQSMNYLREQDKARRIEAQERRKERQTEALRRLADLLHESGFVFEISANLDDEEGSFQLFCSKNEEVLIDTDIDFFSSQYYKSNKE